MRRCARAIILDGDGKLLVFERHRKDNLLAKIHHYYSIPGGGIEDGETPEQAVVRELEEEMMITVVPERLLAHQVDEADEREHYYILCTIAEGTPTFNPQSEEAYSGLVTKNTFEIAWVALDVPLLRYHAAYGQIADYLARGLETGGLPTEAVDMRVEKK